MAIAAIRYNNPGNVSLPIKGWSGAGFIVGISGQPGYARFPSPDVGFSALRLQLTNRINQGLNSISRIGLSGLYENPPTQSWVDNVARYSGLSADETIDPSDNATMLKLQTGICRQETGLSLAQLGVGGAPAAPSVHGATVAGASPAPAPAAKPDLDALLAALLLDNKRADEALKAAQAAKTAVQAQIAVTKARLAEIEKEIG